MSASPCLREVERFFMQDCPLCGRSNRMVVKGVCRYTDDGKTWQKELYPDIGYSFCNCKNLFYTRFENIKTEAFNKFQHLEKPLEELAKKFSEMESGQVLSLVMPDFFFVDWSRDPYEFLDWDPRTVHIMWNMDTFCDEAKEIGFEIVKAERNFKPDTKTPQTMEILLRKP